jgi:hypothetical protein
VREIVVTKIAPPQYPENFSISIIIPAWNSEKYVLETLK